MTRQQVSGGRRNENASRLSALIIADSKLGRPLVKIPSCKLRNGAGSKRKQTERRDERLCFRVDLFQKRASLAAVQIKSALSAGVPDRPQRFLPGRFRARGAWRKNLVQRGATCGHVAIDGSWRPIACDLRTAFATAHPCRPLSKSLPPCFEMVSTQPIELKFCNGIGVNHLREAARRFRTSLCVPLACFFYRLGSV